MVLMMNGIGKQSGKWGVREQKPPGYTRIYYIYSGTVDYTVNGQTTRLPPGSLYLFPSSSPYSITHDPTDTIGCLWFHIDLFPARTGAISCLPVNENTVLWHHLRLLWEAVSSKQTETPYFHHLTEAFTLYLTSSLSLPEYSPALLRAVSQVHASIGDKETSISRIAAQSGYSTEHFIRLFREEMRLTPYQYLLNLRLSKAASLLLTGVPVYQAADAVGYHDAKTFANAFKEKYAVSPARYRQFYQAIP